MRFIQLWLVAAVAATTGCVIVNPGDVQVSASPTPVVVGSRHHEPPRTAYGAALERVLKQQGKVLDELQQRDWKDVVDETADWTEQVRMLSGYADTTHDPVRFRAYCDRLLAQTQSIRESALRHDPVRCQAALRGCDPVLDSLSREFPAQGTAAAVASPSSPHPPAGTPSSVPPRPASSHGGAPVYVP